MADELYWTVIVQQWRGPNDLRHASGNDTVLVLSKIGCKYYRLIGLNCAMATVPMGLVEAALRQNGFAGVVNLGQRRFTVYIEPAANRRRRRHPDDYRVSGHVARLFSR